MMNRQDPQHTDSGGGEHARVRRVLWVLAMLNLLRTTVKTLREIVTQLRSF